MFENASKSFREMNPELFGGGGSCVEGRVSRETGDVFEVEREFQAAAEKWLEERGYARRTEGNVCGESWPERGWFVHVVKAKGNPLVLDLLILGHDGRYLEVELKTRTGAVRKWQGVMVRRDEGAALVRGMGELERVVGEWEKSFGCLNMKKNKNGVTANEHE